MLRYDPHHIPNLHFRALMILVPPDQRPVLLRHPAQVPVREMIGRDDMAVTLQWARIFRHGQRSGVTHCFLSEGVSRDDAREDRDGDVGVGNEGRGELLEVAHAVTPRVASSSACLHPGGNEFSTWGKDDLQLELALEVHLPILDLGRGVRSGRSAHTEDPAALGSQPTGDGRGSVDAFDLGMVEIRRLVERL